jgi:hypothetical protein
LAKTKTDFNGKTTTYAYDSSNRLLSKTPDASFNAPAVTFTYYAKGLRKTMADVSDSTAYNCYIAADLNQCSRCDRDSLNPPCRRSGYRSCT